MLVSGAALSASPAAALSVRDERCALRPSRSSLSRRDSPKAVPSRAAARLSAAVSAPRIAVSKFGPSPSPCRLSHVPVPG